MERALRQAHQHAPARTAMAKGKLLVTPVGLHFQKLAEHVEAAAESLMIHVSLAEVMAVL